MDGRCILAVLIGCLFGASNSQNQGCSGYADVVFLVDSSDGVGNQGFQKELDLVKSTVSRMNIGNPGVHVGMATYGDRAQTIFNLKDHLTVPDITQAVSGAKFVGGSENMLDGLRLVTDQMFTPNAGVRDKTSRLVVLVTAGKSSDPGLTKLQAQKARDNDIDIFTVGIGGAVDMQELKGVASDPDTRYVYTADNFDSAQALSSVIGPKICNEVPDDPQFLPPPSSCLQKVDLMFLVDSSSSIGQTNFQKLEDFLKNTVKDLDVGPDKVRVGLMQYSSYPSLEFPLNMHSSRYDMLKAIDQMSYMGGGANTADAIQYLRQLGFSQNSGARPDVPRVAIVITDGSSANSAGVSKEANNARRANIGLIAVGVGPNVNTGELQAIADDPDSSFMFNPNDYNSLSAMRQKILSAACSVKSTAPSLTTSQPGASPPPDTCKDQRSDCGQYGDICTGTYSSWAQVNCQRFCGFCTPLYTTAAPVCNDLRVDCASLGPTSCTGAYRPYMQANCARFCGYCGPDTQSVGYYGDCAYKGMTYSTGQKWTDGCDYECVCEDGDTGKYRCYNRCPVYHNLPSYCTLVKDPNSCCLQPQCNFDQKVATTSGASKGTKNGINTCVYNGKNYFQDQQWQDGCDSQCICVDASTGRHECHDLCPTYSRLPSYCRLEKKAGQCCGQPVCEFNNLQGTFTGDGSVSSNGVGNSPGTQAPCVDKVSNCALYGQAGCTGQYKAWALDNCRKFCSLCGTGPDPGPNDKCLYNGVQYSQDVSWFVGSDRQCTCENAVSGYYRCTSLCPTYTNLPAVCSVTKVAGQTCDVVKCPSGTFVSSSNNLGTIGNGGNIQNGPSGTYVQPTLPSGANAPPGAGGPADKPPTLKGCLYKGQLYVQGQRWNDGCSLSCECLDADKGQTKCRARCPDYAVVPQGCKATSDPNDACCIKPVCADPNVVPVPHFKPYTTQMKPVAPPEDKNRFTGTGLVGPHAGQATFVQTGTTVPPPTTQKGYTPPSNGVGFCEYKGKQYSQGQSWEDGCDFNCVCDDISYGHYTCVEKCVIYTNIPFPYCHLVEDPANKCCKIPTCTWTAPYPKFTGLQVINPTTPAARATTTPRAPSLAYCEYNGKSYDQGQIWYDGCDFKCTCEEPSTNKYRCESRCPDFPNVAANCQFVPDANDPTCCKVPQCPTPSPATGVTPNPTPTSVPGVITGGETPGTMTGTNKGYCEYNGQRYKQGETWDNGCEFSCVCENQVTGKYKCTEKCKRYTNLASNCRLIDDFANPCCKVPKCEALPEPPKTIAPNPNQGTTKKPGDKAFCVYKGVNYSWGQQWVDGCDRKCQCDNADTGVYSCTERCITYDSVLPPECKLVTDPSDSCCQVPQCGTPTPKVTVRPPLNPGSTLVPGQQGPSTNPIPTAVPTPTAVTGKVTGSAIFPTPAPGPNGQTFTPPTITYCEYKGSRYNQGDKWVDGCTFNCECINALEGKYECKERCPRYVNLSPLCRLVKDPANPCCEKPDCQPNPNGPTTTLAPGVVPPSVSGPTPRPTDVCVYKSQTYTQGQKWFDGCDYSCECENAGQGLYRCDNRCPSHKGVPQGCHFEDDPSDPFCCKVIKCDIPTSVNNQVGTGLIPTPPPAIKTGGYATPAPNPNSPPPMPGQTTQVPVPRGYCVYKGRQYQQGSRWQDGCDFNCECLDGTGQYKCTQICPPYGKLPSACVLVPDVNKPCCKTPYCDFTKVTVTPPPRTTTPIPNPFYSPTPQPRKDVCIYNGVAFKQGQQWDDGCSLRCTCENSTTGFYRCNQRCAQYQDALDPSCQLMTDPRDSCCKVPVCSPKINPSPTGAPDPNNPGKTLAPPLNPSPTGAPDPNNPGKTLAPPLNPSPTGAPDPNNPGKTLAPPVNPFPTSFVYPTPKPGKIEGSLVVPSPRPIPDPNNPGATIIPPPTPGCVYGGKIYSKGQTWQDGCQYNCVCTDGTTGKYTCTERCSLFLNLPSNCRLINDPKDACCKVPDCVPDGGNMPTPKPNPGATPAPGQPTPPPVPQPRNVCVYKGSSYSQGQQWNDGCDKICFCDDAMTGFYRCVDRCPSYSSLPKGCSLIPDPNDPTCCEVPQCLPTPGPNSPVTPGPTKSYPNLPVGQVTGQAPVPSPTTSQPGQTTPTPQQGCYYKNQIYVQGQRWQDGCQYECVCDDGITGKYTCKQRCPVTGNLPTQCKLVQDPKDFCCMTPVCDYSQTPTPGQPPQITLTPTPKGQTPSPNGTPVPTPPVFCVFNGVPYGQGQTWKDGCGTTCRCENAAQNYYSCFDRCPTYKLSPGCTLVTDPKDPCCQVPQCLATPSPNPTPSPGPGSNPGPTPSPGTNPLATPQPYPVPNLVPGTIVGTPPPGQRTGFCEFKGQQYKTGNKWQDGCDFDCECLDQMTGIYQCTQRCSPYPKLPAGCVKVKDPRDQCCEIPYCPNQATPSPGVQPSVTPPIMGQPTTPLPYPTILPPRPTTVAPPPGVTPVATPTPRGMCVYMGKTYSQGQKWDVGCEKVCMCDNGMTGVYSCTDRCPDYSGTRAVSSNCILVPDPADPTCCKIPQCPTAGPNVTPTGLIGVVTGSHLTPIPQRTLTPPTGPVPTTPTPPQVCVYKGKQYGQGQSWQDGCDYECVCLDGMTGNYKCTDRCPRYPNLPLTCQMVFDPQNPCCKKPECPPPTTVGPNGQTPTPAGTPVPDVCVYNGIPYRQGQSWKDGCSKVCVCEDAKTRRINCDDRCPSFQAIPSGCQLMTDPRDSCCQALNCPPPPLGQTVTPLPPAYVTGQSVPAQNPTPFTGGSADVCVYHGKAYKQGEIWQDGCTYTCVCMDSSTGKYMCTDKCHTYPQLPASCTMVQNPKEPCCKEPVCSSQPTPQVGSTPKPGVSTLTPPVMPTPSVDLCVFNGQTYKQGQVWYDGCSKVCRCEDSSMNFYRCEDRCSKYPQVPQGCNLVPDPKDPKCCEVPDCPVQVGPNPTSGFVSTPSYPTPGSVTGIGKIPTNAPTPKPGPGSTPKPTLNPPLPKTGCYYDRKAYATNQKWQVGCKSSCVCVDGTTGQYRCDDLCPPISANLPPKCRAVQDPNNPCCGRVYCDTVNPTPQFPTPGVKPSQNPQVYTPPPTSSFTGQPGFCVYNGVFYSQGQTWKDGCSKTCRCEDVSTGYYSCKERCRTFDQLPPSCKLIVDVNDPCCVVPDCNPDYPTPQPTGPNGVPVPVTGPTPSLIFKPTPAPTGSVIGTGNGPSGMCMYNGKSYSRGQQWDDGCNFVCECIDAQRGQFKCTDKCNKYYGTLPPQCHYEQSKVDQCCQEVNCDFRSTLTPTPPSSPIVVTAVPNMCRFTNNQTYAQGSTWSDGCSGNCKCVDATTNNYICTQRCAVYSNLPSDCSLVDDPTDACCKQPQCTGTLKPSIGGSGPTLSPTLPPSVNNVFPLGTHTTFTGSQLPVSTTPGVSFGSRVGCVYKNQLHRQGDAWNDGCDYVCSCEDESRGIYKCTSKCPQLPPLPSYCNKVNIPGQCCQVVSCNLPGKGTYSPVPELTPDLIPKPGPTPAQGVSTPVPQVIGITGTTGGTGYPGSGAPVPQNVPISQLRDKCVSKDNKMYNQGQSWLQGCDFNCTCLDGKSGYYKCLPLCPVYDSLPKDCYLQQTSSSCCLKPMCTDDSTGITVDPAKNPDQYPVVGIMTGGFTDFRPGYLTTTNSYSGSEPGCFYKSVFYKQGDTWDDGCDYSCTCQDGLKRQFVCNPKCKRYTQIPAGCMKLPDPQSQGCCDIVTCNAQTPTPPPTSATCKDANVDCSNYGSKGKDGCIGVYEGWARSNCAFTCGYCDVSPKTTADPSLATTPSSCQDAIPNCIDYGTNACTGIYKPWAEINCQKHCNFCPSTNNPTASNSPQCHDLLDNCQSIGAYYCQGLYKTWAQINCNSTCQLCDTTYINVIKTGHGGQGTMGPLVTGIKDSFGSYSQPGWATLLKGVSGAPGDLLGLWKSNNTLNPGNTKAMLLTNDLKENYKPALSNYWTDCKFQQIKLSVMTNGDEKAYIIFNATGSNKLSWFDPNRIISSSFTDLQGANFDTFSAQGDPNTGRHFVATQQTQSCDVKGWIMMSTNQRCSFERGVQPAFQYSTTQKSGQFGIDTAKADIFVISGYGEKCFYNPVSDQVSVGGGHRAACMYNNVAYGNGDVWQDKCDLNCTCVDENIGYYKCVDLCPKITNLPAGCRIEKKPGECCGEVKCSPGPSGGCYYKGRFYGQDMEWEDSCDYNCKCVDAPHGFYQCAAKCLTFNNLPQECKMLPAPTGKCCPIVNCPPGIVVNYPDNYVPQ